MTDQTENLGGQECPMCGTKNLTLTETTSEVPYFGRVYLFSMRCSNCKYFISDVEAEEQKDPIRFKIETDKEEDMKIRIVKSSAATVIMPQLRMKMESGPNSIGFISNIEGLLTRFEEIIEGQRDSAEEPEIKTKAKNLLKKIRKIKLGDEKLEIIIEDPSGNSAIISKKAVIEKLKK